MCPECGLEMGPKILPFLPSAELAGPGARESLAKLRFELERRLAVRPGPAPALRGRVLGAVGQALGRERRGGWRFLVTTAAAAVLGVNLSMSVGINTGWREGGGAADLESASRQVRALDPSLSDEEVRREALLVRAAGQLDPGPDAALALLCRRPWVATE